MTEERRVRPTSSRRESDNIVPISEEQMKAIAEMAADLAVQKVIDMGFKAVGKSVVEKFMWVVGVCAVGLYLYLQSKGLIK